MKRIYDAGKLPFGIDDVSLTKVSRDSGFKLFFRNGREFARFVYAIRGQIRYSFLDGNTESMTLCRGDIAYFPGESRHSAEYLCDGTTLYVLCFRIIGNEIPSRMREPLFISDEKTADIFHGISSYDASDPMLLAAKIYEILSIIYRSGEEISKKYLRLMPAIEEIEAHFTAQHKAQYYALLCGMSEAGFRRLFTEYAGMSPIEYRNSLRLHEAKKLIESGEFKAEEAADMTGFSNMSFFYRAYKKTFGKTPRDSKFTS